jgi:hypothetical protein
VEQTSGRKAAILLELINEVSFYMRSHASSGVDTKLSVEQASFRKVATLLELINEVRCFATALVVILS